MGHPVIYFSYLLPPALDECEVALDGVVGLPEALDAPLDRGYPLALVAHAICNKEDISYNIVYRVTIHVVPNLLLTSIQKFCFRIRRVY